MKEIPILRLADAGSQPAEDDELQYVPLSGNVVTFQMPAVPAGAGAGALVTARDTLASFLRDVERWSPATHSRGPRVALHDVPPPALELVNQMLGDGEVSIQIGGARPFKIQESVFTGYWRVCELGRDERLLADWLEAGALPGCVLEAARQAAAAALPPVAVPPGACNSPPLLQEIGAQMRARKPGRPAHVINLTLFPMTPDDHALIDAALPVGPVAIISRSFGNCRITSTLARDVWRVQYFNSMNTLILNTIEIVEVPETALAAVEDLEDSRGRLAELIDWIDESCAEAPAG
jgi:hydrogenase-1 operon protein HyaF